MKKNFSIVLLLLLLVGVFAACNTNENESSITDASTSWAESNAEAKDVSEDYNLKNQSTSTSEVSDGVTAKNNVKTDTNQESKKNDTNTQNKVFTVTFKDHDGKVLKTEEVKKGESAVAPKTPTRKGYKFIKWNTAYDDVKVDIVTTAIYEEITEPTFVVDKVEITSEKEAAVVVSVLNNPGLLGLALNIDYDDSTLELMEVENGLLMSEYMFTPPKNMKSDCNATWSIKDVPKGNNDGEVMILHFKVKRKASKGEYPIQISCNDGAFDDEYNAVAFDTINGSIIIK